MEGGTATCKWVVLDGYLDRRERERVGCEEGEERCDACKGIEETEDEIEDKSEDESEDESDDES
jgi:hypothetical protein